MAKKDRRPKNDAEESKPVSPIDETIKITPEGTSNDVHKPNDPDATVTLETTVGFQEASNETGDPMDPNQKTIAAADLDHTVAIDPQQSVKSDAPTVRTGGTGVDRGKSSEASKTVSVDKTVSPAESTVLHDDRSLDFNQSVMSSPEISVTINPRDLTKQDAKDWTEAVGNYQSEPSILPPAIERSFSDLQFRQLRKCDVAKPKSDPQASSDYRLIRKLGQGGMGDVFVARQGSLDRLLALKVIKPLESKRIAQLVRTGKLEAVEEERRLQFLAEAIITGDLDHPNIVPIHDVAVTEDGELFYSMKRVIGTPWSEVIKQKSRDENIEILLKVADAIAFAHTRGVVHRDIKPENIMLGDFGVVMVMDWGLALPTSPYPPHKQASILSTTGLGGTPAFMAPEMATGPLDHIGPAADIYLLGATLFMIVTGNAPHQAKNVTECLKAVRNNKIRDVPDERKGELLDIAMRAMASNPQDRYADVEQFQQAIRDYRSHAESITLASGAQIDLERGRQLRAYADLSRATFGFEEAIKSWPGNAIAQAGLAESRLAHAEAAYENGDFDLGLSLLDDQNPQHTETIQRLSEALEERESRVGRLALMKKVAVAMLAFIIVGGAVAIFVINSKRNEAIEARADAVDALAGERRAKEDATRSALAAKQAEQEALVAADKERKAKQIAQQATEEAWKAAEAERVAKKIAEDATQIAINEKLKAEMAADAEKRARDMAVKAAEQARIAKEQSEYEEYVSKIGLAKARLERNEADGARDILRQLQNSPRASGWEWRWLWQQANQSQSDSKAAASVIDLSVDPSGRRGSIVMSNGKVEMLQFAVDGRIESRHPLDDSQLARQRATAVAISPDGHDVAVGCDSGAILVIGRGATRAMARDHSSGHTGRITDLQFSRDGLLVSGSLDRTVRVWNIQSGQELTAQDACWHLSPVRQLAVSGTASSMTLAVATSDDASGQVAIWKLRHSGEMIRERLGTFSEHPYPVSSVSLIDDGTLAASGDTEGNVWIWDPTAVEKVDYAGSVDRALAKFRGNAATKPTHGRAGERLTIAKLFDANPRTSERLVSNTPMKSDAQRAHDDVVKSIRFSSDGKLLLTGSDDYTLKVWDVGSQQLQTTLRGHGGWVTGGDFIGRSADLVVSASNDSTVRTWKPAAYRGSFVSQHVVVDVPKSETRNKPAHSNEISSACFSPDGSRVVTASRDHTARVMEIDEQTLTFRQIAHIQDEVLQEGTSFVAMSLEVDRSHKRLYVGSADATIRIWNLQRGVELARIPRTGLNDSFAVSPDGRFLLSGSSSPAIKGLLWRLDPSGNQLPQVIHRLKGHDQAVTAFAISPDAKMLFTGDRDGFGILWDAVTGQPIGLPVEHVRGFRINKARFSSDGRELFLASDDQQLTRIDVSSRRRIGRLDHDGFVTRFSLSHDGRFAVCLSEFTTETRLQTKATLWDLRDGSSREIDRVTQPHPTKGEGSRYRHRITSAHFDETSETLVVCYTGSSDHGATVKVWNQNSLRQLSDAPVLTRRMARSMGNPTKPDQVFELPQQLSNSEVALPLGNGELLTMHQNGAFRWNLSDGRLIKSYRSHAALTEANFSFDGLFVATASRSVKIWDVATGKSLSKLEAPHVGPVRSVHFAPIKLGPSGYVLATAGDDGIARVWKWDPNTQKIDQLSQYTLGQDTLESGVGIHRVRFSPDAKRLLAVGSGGTAIVWTLDRLMPPVSLEGKDAGDFVCGAFSSDGNSVAIGSTDHRIRVWSIPRVASETSVKSERGITKDNNTADQTLSPPVVLEGHADVVLDVALLGRADEELRVFSASADDSARVWDPRLGIKDSLGNAARGREILSLRQHTADVTAVDITDNGALLMTAGADGNVILWPAD